ncbi:MAG: SLBB domain-containing protein, partial [Bacteroidetes bacterium]|nr:SLBB domain-containing protein [Bacteroidota bacterium]
MMQRRSRLLLYAFMLAFTATLPVQAQTFGRVGTMIAEGSSYHVFAKPGEATVQIQVLGNVKFPGIYEVGVGTDLGQLLALTGGPVQEFT